MNDLGAVESLIVLKDLSTHDQNPIVRSLASASAQQIKIINKEDPTAALIEALEYSAEWIVEEWLTLKLGDRWDHQVGEALNRYLQQCNITNYRVVQAVALLLQQNSLWDETLVVLSNSANKRDRLRGEYARTYPLLELIRR